MKYKLESKENEHSCLECGKAIYGRADRKFCSLDCKNGFNNRKHRKIRVYKNDIIDRLSKNYEILESLLRNGILRIERERLISMGFDDNLFTSSRRGLTRHEERSCFDISYSRSENRIFHIHREIV